MTMNTYTKNIYIYNVEDSNYACKRGNMYSWFSKKTEAFALELLGILDSWWNIFLLLAIVISKEDFLCKP